MNLLTSSWDLYTRSSTIEDYLQQINLSQTDNVIRFRELCDESYIMYREVSQIVDALIMVHETLTFNGGLLVAALIYLFMGIHLKIFVREEVAYAFAQSSTYLLDQENAFNNVYRRFVNVCFGIAIEELIPYAQYVSPFFALPMDHSPIKGAMNQKNFDVSGFIADLS